MPHVLVIDDEVYVCKLVQVALEAAAEYRVTPAVSGAAAVPTLDRDRPDLLILDALLPGISGIEIAQQASSRNIPVLMVTGNPEAASRLEDLGWPVLRKPFAINKLLAEVRETIARAQENVHRVRGLYERMQRNHIELAKERGRSGETRERAKQSVAAARKTTMSADPDTIRAAYHMIENHGARAALVAEQRSANSASGEAAATWERVARAIRKIEDNRS